MPNIPVGLDTTEFNVKLRKVQDDIEVVDKQAISVKEKIGLYYQQSQIVTNLILQQMKDTAAGQALLTAQQVYMLSLSVKTTMAQAVAAAAAGNYISAGLLSASAATMVGLQLEAYELERQQKAVQREIDASQNAQQTFRGMYI